MFMLLEREKTITDFSMLKFKCYKLFMFEQNYILYLCLFTYQCNIDVSHKDRMLFESPFIFKIHKFVFDLVNNYSYLRETSMLLGYALYIWL